MQISDTGNTFRQGLSLNKRNSDYRKVMKYVISEFGLTVTSHSVQGEENPKLCNMLNSIPCRRP